MNYKKTLFIISGFLCAQSCLGMEEERTIFYVGKDNKAREHGINAQELYHMRIPADEPKLKPAEQPKKLTQVQNTQPQIVQIRVINQPSPAASRPQLKQEMVHTTLITSNPDIRQLEESYQKESEALNNMLRQRAQLFDELVIAIAHNDLKAADDIDRHVHDQLDGAIATQKLKLKRINAQVTIYKKKQELAKQAKQQEAMRASSKSTAVTSESKTLPVTIMTMASDSKPQEPTLFGPSLAHHEPTLELPEFMIAHPREGDEYKISAPEFRHNQQQNLEEALEKITTQDAAEFKEQTA